MGLSPVPVSASPPSLAAGIMEHKKVFLTEDGLKKVEHELGHLRNVRRAEVAEKIHQAKELEVDAISAEYDEAKNEQAFIEGRILELETTLQQATVVHHEKGGATVEVGSSVRLVTTEGEEESYTIVGSAEVSSAEGKISNESPVGQALLGKSVGEEVEVPTPAGVRRLKLVEVS